MIFLNVLAWNGEKWLRRCLDSLLESLEESPIPGRVMVVDNASTDGTPAILASYGDRVEVLRLPGNLGFAGGHNAGIRRALEAGARWVALLNQDLWVTRGWIAPLLQVAASRPRAGVLSPFQYDYEGKDLDPGFRRTLTFIPEAAQGLSTGRWGDPCYASDMATGAAIVVHRRVFENVGLFDPAYFAYHEEVDFYNRAMAAGAEILLVPASRVHHWHSLRRETLPRRLSWINLRNFYRQILKKPGSRFIVNLYEAAGRWRLDVAAAVREGRWSRAAALVAIGLLDLPPRIPSLMKRRREEAELLRRAGTGFTNRDADTPGMT